MSLTYFLLEVASFLYLYMQDYMILFLTIPRIVLASSAVDRTRALIELNQRLWNLYLLFLRYARSIKGYGV